MIFQRNFFVRFLCSLHEQRKERTRIRLREERRRKAAREWENGWADLFHHMSRNAARSAPGSASRPVSLTAREAAIEAKHDEAIGHQDERALDPAGNLPLARPPREGGA